MTKNPKSKGNQFERDMCELFSLWASHGKHDDWFWRTPGSGGRATARAKRELKAEDYAGDMMALDVRGRILTKDNIFEFKKGYSETSIASMLDKLEAEKDPIIIRWWKKLDKEKSLHNKERAFLVFKRNRKETCIAMASRSWLFDIKEVPDMYIIVRYKNIYLSICKLEDFFRIVGVDKFCQLPIKELKGEKRKLKIRRSQKPTKLKVRR